MKLGGRADLETSVTMSEFILMKELPQLTLAEIEALPMGRAALLVALAEDVGRRRKAAMAAAGRGMGV